MRRGRAGDLVERADGRFRIGGLTSNIDWPVSPHLGTLLPGHAQPLDGWLYIAATAQDLDGPMFLQYQPLVAPTAGGAEPKLVSEILIHAP